MSGEVVARVLADLDRAPISEGLRETLRFLGKLTLEPAAVRGEDLAPVRAAGVSDDAIEDALHVCTAFNIMDRLADAFDYALMDEAELSTGARFMIDKGYRI